jgi:glutathione S-transferase
MDPTRLAAGTGFRMVCRLPLGTPDACLSDMSVLTDTLVHGGPSTGKLTLLGSWLTTLARAGSGARVGDLGARPARRLVLYEMENCPYSRKVREALTILDLDADIRPCPEGSPHRRELQKLGGKERVPMLHDPNTDVTLYDSERIVDYLFKRYGGGKAPARLRGGRWATWSSKLASRVGGNRSTKAQAAVRPTLPLELWSYEASPDCRVVREVLGRYCLPYVLYNVGKNSAKKNKLVRISGGSELPFLIDPNRGTRVLGADRIRDYLHETYGASTSGVRPTPLRKVAPAPNG